MADQALDDMCDIKLLCVVEFYSSQGNISMGNGNYISSTETMHC